MVPTETPRLCLHTKREAGRPRSRHSLHFHAPLDLASKLKRGGVPSSGLLGLPALRTQMLSLPCWTGILKRPISRLPKHQGGPLKGCRQL